MVDTLCGQSVQSFRFQSRFDPIVTNQRTIRVGIQLNFFTSNNEAEYALS